MSGSWKRRAIALSGALTLASGVLAAWPTPAGAAVGDENAFTTAWETAGTTQIDLSGNVTLTCTSGTPTRNSSTAVVVNGHGHMLTQDCPNDRVLQQDGTGKVTLQDITVTGGSAPGSGGALETNGAAAVTDSTLAGNDAGDGEGGAIHSNGPSLDITRSFVSGNSASGSGGAISAGGVVTVTDSTLSANSSGNNGGAIRGYGDLTVVNSTVTNNTATNDGGGIDAGPVTLVYATVVDNTGQGGANISGEDSAFTSFGSVLALPHGSLNCMAISSTTSNGYNADDDGSCGFGSGTGDHSNLATPLQLGALSDNGGPAPTRLPAGTSPLVDAVAVASCGAGAGITADERGITRPQGPGCDIGAVEVAVTPPPTTPPTTPVAPTTVTTSRRAAAVTVTPSFTG